MSLRLAAVLLLLAATARATPKLTRGPYLQLQTTHAVTVVWNTSAPAACALAIRPLDGDRTVIDGATGTVCAIAVDGLESGGRYAYVPQADGVALAGESIFQADDATLPYVFLVAGDTGGATSAQLAVRDRMVKTPADFILSTGDMIYEVGAASAFDPQFFVPYQALLRHLVFWPCMGNHDYATAHGQPWRDAFYTPANNPARDEAYYSFDFGNAHVSMLDSNIPLGPGSAQYRFLDDDLGRSDATWKFVAFHHTIYTSGPTTTIRTALVPLFDRHAVDVVFMGHVHAYERTKPLRANKIVPAGTGTVYVTTGGGGRSVGSITKTSVSAYVEATSHFTRVAVDGDVLLLQMIRADGTVRDETSLVKGSVTTTTSTSTTSTTTPVTTLRFAAAADAYVDAGKPTTGFGGAKTMIVQGKPVRIGYVRFDVAGLAGRVVTSATLRLTVDAASGADGKGGGTVRGVADTTWTESGLTYQSRPLLDGPLLATWGRVARKQVVPLDVGPAVVGDGSVAFALESGSSDDVRWATRDAKRGAPELVVTVVP
jgi:calcineurin-like phosphoesterase family protein